MVACVLVVAFIAISARAETQNVKQDTQTPYLVAATLIDLTPSAPIVPSLYVDSFEIKNQALVASYGLNTIPEVWKPKTAPSWTYRSCVEYAKWVLGQQGQHWGNAWDIKSTHQEPQIKDVILLTDGPGHVGVVISVGSTSITFTEANYRQGQVSQRTLLLTDQSIIGYWQ